MLEDPATTGLPDGIPYVMNIGNHDGSAGFNQVFGVDRFAGRGYYGGHRDSINDDSYILFSGAGRDFVLVSLAYAPQAAALNWAHGVIASHPDRLAVVVSHSMLNTGPQATWTGPGSDIYEALKDLPNLVLMACGHIPGEGRRTDLFQGRPVTTMLSDYQMRDNAGSGWLRVLEFAPTWNTVRAHLFAVAGPVGDRRRLEQPVHGDERAARRQLAAGRRVARHGGRRAVGRERGLRVGRS